MGLIKNLKFQIQEINGQIKEIQDQCSHPISAVTKEHGASTGNYDPTADCYWTDFHCKLCDKRWTEDGSK